EGQAFVYEPVVSRSQAQKKALGHVLSRFFENSPELLVMNLLNTEQIDAEDLQRIQKLIQQGLGEHIAGDPGNVVRQKLEIATGKLRRPDLGGWVDGLPGIQDGPQIPPDGFPGGTLIPHGPPVPPPPAAPDRVPESGLPVPPPPPEP